jgi:hypothetical protein
MNSVGAMLLLVGPDLGVELGAQMHAAMRPFLRMAWSDSRQGAKLKVGHGSASLTDDAANDNTTAYAGPWYSIPMTS